MSETTAVDEAAEVDPATLDEPRGAVVEALRAQLGDAITDVHIKPGLDLWVRVRNDAWADAAASLRYSLNFRYFGFLSVIDWMPSPFGRYLETEGDTLEKFRAIETPTEFETGYAGGESRFQVFARVMSIPDGMAINIKADTSSDDDLMIASWTKVYAGADWHEREAWEMYGVTFTGHPGLRHMYLPGNFEGNPMRKDFPLLARLVKPWPGIVDVEPMPGSDDEPAEGSGSAEGDAS